MRIATKANVRTTQAAKTSLAKALSVSFTGGSVMGLGVTGLAVIGLGSLFILFYTIFVHNGDVNSPEYHTQLQRALEVLTGSPGRRSIALLRPCGRHLRKRRMWVLISLKSGQNSGVIAQSTALPVMWVITLVTFAERTDSFGSTLPMLGTMVLGREGNGMDQLEDWLYSSSMIIAGTGILFIIGTFFVRIKKVRD
jgi:K(+)-stimulated pyrophosphate-energized sodium pump